MRGNGKGFWDKAEAGEHLVGWIFSADVGDGVTHTTRSRRALLAPFTSVQLWGRWPKKLSTCAETLQIYCRIIWKLQWKDICFNKGVESPILERIKETVATGEFQGCHQLHISRLIKGLQGVGSPAGSVTWRINGVNQSRAQVKVSCFPA